MSLFVVCLFVCLFVFIIIFFFFEAMFGFAKTLVTVVSLLQIQTRLPSMYKKIEKRTFLSKDLCTHHT